MIDPVQVQQLQQIAERAAAGGGSGPGKADGGAVMQFEEALGQSGQQPQAAAAGQPDAANAAQAAGPADKAATPGDAILDGIDKMRTSFSDGMQRVGETLNKDQVDAKDMLKIQMELQSIALQQDLMAKVSGKATQSLDQLLKG